MTVARALVSLTFDDALDEHLDRAIPILEVSGLRGTFYVDAGGAGLTGRHREWSAAAARGHELGNHTIFHPGVSSKSWVSEGIALESYSTDRMRLELLAANRILSMLDGREERSFAFPCGNPWIGRPGWPQRALARMRLDRTRISGWIDRLNLDFGSERKDYTPVVRELFAAARLGAVEVDAFPVLPPDLHRVAAVGADGMGLEELQSTVRRAKDQSAWLVLTFHGIGGGHHMSCEQEVFAALTRSLANDESVEVVTFLEGARRSRLAGASHD